MWMIFARAPPPDVPVWAGRRSLALVDAIAWPVVVAAFAQGHALSSGVTGLCLLALCIASAVGRAHRAWCRNHRYHFTTWRWGRRLLPVLLFGYALKLALLLSAGW